MASFKNYFVDETKLVPNPALGQAPSYTLEEPTLEEKRMFAEEQRVADKLGIPAQDVRELDLRNVGGVGIPPSMTRPKALARPFAQPAGLESPGRALREPVEMPETVPSLTMPSGVPAKTSDFASLQKLMSAGSLASPIPVNLASPRSDTTPVRSEVIASSGPATPAPPADTGAKPNLPAPSSEGAGGDVSERDLYLARLAAQSAAGFGGMGAGKNIDMGIADTLGERLKQVQALRAKREEQSLVDARERANNRAQVEYLMQRFPERREALAGLLDVTKSPNFAQMLRVEEQIALDKARQAQAAATTGQIQALTPVKVEAGLAGAEGKRAQTKSRTYTDALTQAKTENEIARKGMIAAQAEALRAKAELDKAKAAGAGDTDSRTVNARQKLVDAYQKQYLAPAESLAAVEAKAPGLTRGQPPDWLTGEQLQLVRNNVTYELASDDTKDVFAAAQKYLDGYRKQQYGSALTATEQAELERLVKADIFTGADKMSRFFDLIRKDIANNFQNKLKGDRLVQQSFVDKYVGAEEGPLAKFVGPQGLFSDVWTLAKAPAAGETQQPANKPAPREGIRWMLSPEGAWKGIKEADVEKAKTSGFRE